MKLNKNHHQRRFTWAPVVLTLLVGIACVSCSPTPDTGEDPQVTTVGSFEVTAQLVEIPEAFPDIPLYDYAFVLKYKILETHRGEFGGDTIYVAHYNPLKPREDVADIRSGEIGGNLKRIKANQIHRMALEVPVEDHYMGGIINKYFEQDTGPVYWAVWANRVIQ